LAFGTAISSLPSLGSLAIPAKISGMRSTSTNLLAYVLPGIHGCFEWFCSSSTISFATLLGFFAYALFFSSLVFAFETAPDQMS
jgi:hypothetical protein